jgi:D-alanine-D-alanine ligase
MADKLRVAVLFGGRSGEYEVSLMSARSVLSVLSPEKYDVVQIGITREGRWLTGRNVLDQFSNGRFEGLSPVVISPDASGAGFFTQGAAGLLPLPPIDIFFPVLHGTFGEDGTLQGLFEMANVAYVGAGVLGSSVGMDKGVFKDVMLANGIPVVNTLVFLRSEIESDIASVIARSEAISPYPIFTKPANLGSSVGITKCNNRSDLQEGLIEAAAFDRRVLAQQGIVDAREIEISVLGNHQPIVSVPGEVLPSREFYSYESKYIDGTSGLVIPAELPAETTAKIQSLALLAYQAIDCAGMARVDFFVQKGTGNIYLNEVNTIPGFTQISMYPKLWEASGLPYPSLVDRLIELGMQRKMERDHIQHSFRGTA